MGSHRFTRLLTVTARSHRFTRLLTVTARSHRLNRLLSVAAQILACASGSYATDGHRAAARGMIFDNSAKQLGGSPLRKAMRATRVASGLCSILTRGASEDLAGAAGYNAANR